MSSVPDLHGWLDEGESKKKRGKKRKKTLHFSPDQRIKAGILAKQVPVGMKE